MRTIVNPDLRRRSSSRMIPAWTVTSSAVVGSSATRSFGRHASATAMAIRCRIPPENWCGKARSALGIRDPYLPQGLDGQLGCGPTSEAEMQAHVLGELRSDGQHRMQGGHGILEDHRKVAAADPA